MFHTRSVVASILSNYLIALLVTAASNGGFNVELIRRDSPKSPFYNANQTPRKRLDAFSQRRMRKVHPSAMQSEVRAYEYNYLLKLSMGTPPVDIYGIIDTGSELFWTQCVPCDGCFKKIYPLFDPSKSSTYSDISCQSEQCPPLDSGMRTCSPNKICNYDYKYIDGSLTKGVLAKETVTMTSISGEKLSVDIVFGCGHNNSGSFNDHEMGLIGFGGGSMSFVSQIASTFGSKRFSHCFVPFGTDPSIPSKMSFGNGSEVLGDGVVSTPLISKYPPLYVVTLNGISVGNKYLPFESSSTFPDGNTCIDSGSTEMFLPQVFYDRLVAEVKQQIPLDPIVGDEDLGQQELCYRSEKDLDAPILTIHFEGADVLLMPIHTFILTEEGIFCFQVFVSPDDEFVTYGNYAQSNFLIGYDMEKMTVSFKMTDCTK